MKVRTFFTPNRLFWVVCLIVSLLMLTGLVMAQDEPLTPGLENQPITPTGVVAAFTFFGGTLLVSGIVGLLKFIPGNTLSAETMKDWVAAAVTVVYLGFVMSGHADLFNNGSDISTNLLPYISGVIGVLFGSSGAHSVAYSLKLPVFGYKRTPQLE